LKCGLEEDNVKLMIAPCQRWGADQEDRNLEADSPSASPMEGGTGGFSPVSGRTRGRMAGGG